MLLLLLLKLVVLVGGGLDVLTGSCEGKVYSAALP